MRLILISIIFFISINCISQTMPPSLAQNFLIGLKANSYTPRGKDVQSSHLEVVSASIDGKVNGSSSSNYMSHIVAWWSMVGNTLTSQSLNLINTSLYPIVNTGSPTANDGYTSYNGTTQRGNITAVSAFVPTSFTYTSWINAVSWSSAYQGCFTLDAFGSSDYIASMVKSTGKLAIYIGHGGANAAYDGIGINTLSTGTWYQIAVTYDGSTHTMTGYVNASLDGSNTNVVMSGVNYSGLTLNFGQDNNVSGRFFNGSVSECMIFDKVLSGTELTNLFNTQKAIKGF